MKLFAMILVAGAALSVPSIAFATTYLIKPDGTGDFATIQEAVDAPAVVAGDIIELTDGTFTGDGNRDVDYSGKAITVRSQSGDREACIIDCQNAGRGFWFHSGEGPGSVVEGLTITRGSAGSGAGVMCENGSSPSLTNCAFLTNTASNHGGGIWCDNSSPTATNCSFSDNSAVSYGGGMAIESSSLVLVTDCTFSGNRASVGSGAFCRFSSPITFTSCTFTGNSADDHGGGIYKQESSLELTNCIFSGNSADQYGGGLFNQDPGLCQVSGCTFSGNSAITSGGGVHCYASGSITSTNTIIAFSTQGGAAVCRDNSTVTLTSCCDVFGNTGGNWDACISGQAGNPGNMEADPLFCDRDNGDYYLQVHSPCAPDNSPGECGLIGALGVATPPAAVLAPMDTAVCVDEEVCFRNFSEPVDSIAEFRWYFGDGDTSAEFEPCHTYSSADTYEVKLVALGPCTPDSTVGQVVVIEAVPTAGFSSTIRGTLLGCSPFEVCFTDESEGDIWWRLWDFGDGMLDSTSVNPCHAYICSTYSDTFDVTLAVGNPCGWDTLTNMNNVLVFEPPTACISPEADTVCVGDEICFYDCSRGMYTGWEWDFGDGADTSGVADPCHTYDQDEIKTIQLFVNGPFCGADTTMDTIMVCAPPLSIILPDTITGLAPLAANFCDVSTGCIASRLWDAGDPYDPQTETTACLDHTYGIPGTYYVALYDEGFCGSDRDTAVVIALATGVLCFEPDILDTTYHCLTGNTIDVDITLNGNIYPVGTIGFDVTYESSNFKFLSCANGDLTAGWPPIGCQTTRGIDSVSVYGDKGAGVPIPLGASGNLLTLTFEMDCTGMVYGDSIPSLKCITNLAYDCSTFVSCRCREEWMLTGLTEVVLDTPLELSLSENYPNPFNPGTTIEYDLPAPGGRVNLAVYNVQGRLVRMLVDGHVEPGRQVAHWDGDDDAGKPVPSGIYFYRLSTPQGVEQRKAVVLK